MLRKMKKGFFAASALALLSLVGCGSTSVSPPPSPRNTEDAVREMTVVLASQCMANEVTKGMDFKVCFKQKLDAAVDQIGGYQKCASPVGCKPRSNDL